MRLKIQLTLSPDGEERYNYKCIGSAEAAIEGSYPAIEAMTKGYPLDEVVREALKSQGEKIATWMAEKQEKERKPAETEEVTDDAPSND